MCLKFSIVAEKLSTWVQSNSIGLSPSAGRVVRLQPRKWSFPINHGDPSCQGIDKLG